MVREKEAIGANACTTVKRSALGMGKSALHVGDDMRIDVAMEEIQE